MLCAVEASGCRQTAAPGGGPQAAELPATGQGAAALGRISPGSPPAGGDGLRRGLSRRPAGATPGAPAGDGGAEEQVQRLGFPCWLNVYWINYVNYVQSLQNERQFVRHKIFNLTEKLNEA